VQNRRELGHVLDPLGRQVNTAFAPQLHPKGHLLDRPQGMMAQMVACGQA
jgi:hypothetical protein